MAKVSERRISIGRSVGEAYRGVLLLMNDARRFRPVESVPGKRPLRRLQVTTKPIRSMTHHIRAEYDRYLEWLDEPESHRPRPGRKLSVSAVRERAHLPSSRKQQKLEGPHGLVQWRLAMEADQWSTKRVRHHVLMLTVAFQALDRLEEFLDELDERLSRRWTLADVKASRDRIDDFAPQEVLEVMATLVATFAPFLSDTKQTELSTGLMQSIRQSRKRTTGWERRPKPRSDNR